ncbi:MAG: amino acid adenylation domain-containing protein, partial [Candidatus Aminicenantes bacterium]
MSRRNFSDKIALAANQNIKERDYWLNRLSGDFVKSNFPYDFKVNDDNKTNQGMGEVRLECPGDLFEKLMKLSRGIDIKLHMILVAGLAVLLYKYTNSEDVVTGSPIIKQKTQGQFINTVLVYRNRLRDIMSFKELLLQVRETVIKAAENQNYPIEFLVDRLNLPTRGDEFPLFDVVLLLENIHDKQYLEGINYHTLFSFFRTDESINLGIRYQPWLYLRETIERIVKHFMCLLDQVLGDLNMTLSSVDLLSDVEKQQLLVDFNSSTVDYPVDKTITALFAEQVEQTPDYIALVGAHELQELHETPRRGEPIKGTRGLALLSVPLFMTYKELNEKSNQLAHLLKEKGVQSDSIVGIMMERSIEMIIGVMAIIKAGGAYLPIDPTYPDERIDFMVKDSQTQLFITQEHLKRKVNVGEHCKIIDINYEGYSSRGSGNWASVNCTADLVYVVYTSGSTGKPKGVLVQHLHFVNAAFAWRKEYHLEKMTTNLLQMAPFSFDVFGGDLARALLNGGKMVITPQSGMDPESLYLLITRHEITLFESTPSYLVPFMQHVYDHRLEVPSLKLLILGSDICRVEDFKTLLARFGQWMRIINSYGVTEATIDSSYYEGVLEYPTSSGNVPIGKPLPNMKFYILNPQGMLQPMGAAGELCIGGAGVARGYLNQPELTAEKFLSVSNKYYRSYMSHMSYIYKTGDLARWLPDGNVEFLGRMDHQVKVRGYRIELGEIESKLLEHEDIKEAVVVEKTEESDDRYLCGYIISGQTLEAAQLREYLGQKLPDYMVPWFFVQMDRFPLTPNGKIDRKALPDPDTVGEVEYAAPGSKAEHQLVDIWAGVLSVNKETLGIDNRFFDLGGNSLKAIMIIAKIHKTFDVKISLADIFNIQTIRGVSRLIEKKPGDKFISIEPAEKKEYYKLSSAQKRLYILQQMELDGTAYNISQIMEIQGELEKERLKTTFCRLIKRHESLRTSFKIIGDRQVQEIHDEVEFEIEYYDAVREPDVKGIIKNFLRPFDLSQAPLLRAGLVKEKEDRHILMADMHHIISDGVSHEILIKDFLSLYEGKKLPMLNLQYKDYSEWQANRGEREKGKQALKKQEEYWQREFEGEIPVLNLPTDYTRPPLKSFAGSTIGFEISGEEIELLKEYALDKGVTQYMVFLAIFYVFLAKVSNQEDLVIGTPTVGRRHTDLEQIIGMFVNTLALRNYPKGEKTFTGFLREIKERTVIAFENQEYPFEDLVEKVAVNRDTSRNPLFDTMFTLQDIDVEPGEKPGEKIPGLKAGQYQYESEISKFDLSLNVIVARKRIYFTFEYCTKLFKPETIKRLIKYFKKIISAVLNDPEKKNSEIEILSGEEKNQILYKFNDTGTGYPKDKTIHELFEEQAEKSRDSISVIGMGHGVWGMEGKGIPRNIYITYNLLNERSDQLAHLLTEKGVQPDTIVGIMMKRSIEMIIAVLGILKAGGAYLPIDPEYPNERIDFMLKDSNVGVLLTTPKLQVKVKVEVEESTGQPRQLPLQLINIESELAPAFEPSFSTLTSTSTCRVSPTNLAYVIYTSGSTGKPKGVMVEHKSLVNYVCWGMKRYIDGKGSIFPLYTSISFDLTVTSIFLPIISGNRVMIYPGDENQLAVLKIMEENAVDIVKLTPSHLGILSTEMKTKNSRINTFIVGGEKLESALALAVHNRFPGNLEIYNEYGPTEATVGCMIYKFDNKAGREGSVPIGVPIENVKIYILDNYLKPVPTNVIGEIYIGGAALARGYLNNPELTAQKFQIPKFQTNLAAKKREETRRIYSHMSYIYQTGDLARLLPDGNIEFLGRKDQQVKIRGYRIELGEIENRLLNNSQVKEVVVVAREETNGDRYLCAYIVPDSLDPAGTRGSTGAVDVPGLREFLSEELPAYMVPSYIMPLDKIPLTPNGKVDRKALPVPVPVAKADYAAPGNAVEEKLIEIWIDVLGLASDGRHDSRAKQPIIGIDDNFFELGGHSLKATILASIIHKEFNVKVALADIFKRRTVKELAQYIKDAKKNEYVGIEPVEKKEYYPLSPAQKRLYFLQQLDPESTSYNVPLVLSIERDIDMERFELALTGLIARHESLRTSFVKVNEVPYQKIHNEAAFEVRHYDSDAEDIIKDFIRPFDLSRAPLLRIGVINDESSEGLLLFDMHHIVTDDRSHNIMKDEFMELFSGINHQLPPLCLQYKDYSQWLNSPEQQEMVKRQEAYWIQLFFDELPVLTLPLDYPRPEFQSFEGSSMQFVFNREETKHLQELSGKSGTTLYMTLLSIFNILLWKLSGHEDIIVGTPIAARRHADLQKIIGMFVNTIVMRSCPSGHKTFQTFLKEIKTQTLKAFENQEYPFEDLVDKILEKRDTSRNPIFDVMFTFISDAEYAGDIPGSDENPRFEYKKLTSKFDLNLTAVDLGKGIFFDLEYCTKLFNESTIDRIIKYFKKITRLVSGPQNRNLELSEIEIITDEERRHLLFEFNNTTADFPRDKTIHRLFEEQVERTPDQIALIGQIPKGVAPPAYKKSQIPNKEASGGQILNAFGETISITYKELNKKSNQLAHLLQTRGVKPDSIVGLMVERSIEMIIGILAVLKAGGAYLPIDAEYPGPRKTYMIKDSGVKLLLTNYNRESQGEWTSVSKEIDIIDLRDEHVYHRDTNNPEPMNTPSDLIYLIYTSGSTGKPKGVMLEHQNLVNLLIWGFRFTNLDFTSILQFATISFDASFHEIFSAFLSGGQLVLVPKEMRTDISKLFDLIERNQVKTIFLPMSLLKVIFSEGDYIEMFPACVAHIQTAGEQVVVSDQFRNYLKENNIYLHNHYGPSEAHVVTALTMAPSGEIPVLPSIGKPVSNTEIYILDKYGNVQPGGVPGELYIGGVQVGRGYLNRPELTAKMFLSVSKKIYRTGDLARWLWDGNIEFLGRIDHQVKIRGFRIELGEIEARLLKHESIKEAVVMVLSTAEAIGAVGGEKYLCAYIVSAGAYEQTLNPATVREFLSQTLPDYMIPSYFIPVDKIPLTPNGKVDRKALPQPSAYEITTGKRYTPPGDEIERKLVKIWSGVLGEDAFQASIGIDDNFFELGGHSLKATILASKIHKELNVKVPLAALFKSQTVRGLSKYIRAAKESKYAGIESAEKKEYYPLSSAQKRLYFLRQIDPGSTSYNMPLVLPLGKDIEKNKLETTLRKLILRHENLRTSFERVNEEPVQRIHEDFNFEIEYFDSASHAPGSMLHASTIKAFIRPFDLSRAPLIRSGLIKLAEGYHIWIVDMHHIISDGTSHTILTEDFLALYSGKELEPLRLHYKDFSQWQNRLFASGEIKGQEDYWLGLFSGEIPRLELPTDFKRPEVFTFAGDSYGFMLEKEDALAFKALGNKYGATLYMNILTALSTLFYKYTGQTDIIIGSGIAGRPHADLQHIIGMFVNTLVMRNTAKGEKTYESFLEEVIDVSVKAFENQDVQFEELVEKLNLERDPSRNPLFDISMVVQNFRKPGQGGERKRENENYNQTEVLPLADENLPSIDYKISTTKFDMTFFVIEMGDDVSISIEYYTGIFKQQTIHRLSSHFKHVIKEVIRDPLIRLKDIEIIPGEEKDEILYTFNHTSRDYPQDKTLVSLFEEQVEKIPHHIAIGCDDEELTYNELDKRANRLAGYLYYEKGVRPGNEDRVGILMSQSLELSISLFGILKTGAAYVPLDPQLPPERIKYMINNAGISTVVSEKRYVNRLNRLQWECECFHSYLCLDSFDIHEEDEREKSELMNEELWHHVGETATDDITGGGWVSSYTGEPFSKEEMDEYGDNILKKLEPLLHKDMGVLEIGCASGISMYRIAPKVGLYYGTDLSRVIIEKNKERVVREGHKNIKLASLPAHEIHQLKEKGFDLVIMNSVIQCFHGHNYLKKVIKKAIDLLGETGYLFIGDVMDQDKKDMLTQEMAAFKYAAVNRDKGYTTKTDFTSELFLSKGFWKDLGVECNEIASIKFSDKIYTIENELTKFRYDVLITIDKQPVPIGKGKRGKKAKKKKKEKYQDDMRQVLRLGSKEVQKFQTSSLTLRPNNLAYIIYTSGTTGQPKGVEVEHRGVVNTLWYRKEVYGMNPGFVCLQLFSYAFDGFVTSFFTPLISGSTVILLEQEKIGDIEIIKDTIVRNRVTHFISVPSLYSAVIETLSKVEVASLHVVTLAGDKVNSNVLVMTRMKSDSLEIVNEYGVTE